MSETAKCPFCNQLHINLDALKDHLYRTGCPVVLEERVVRDMRRAERQEDSILVLDRPEQIKAYQIIATIHGLHMEIDMKEKYGTPPTALPTRGRALATARQLLNHSGHLTRKQALKLMEEKYPQFAKKSTAIRREA